MKLFISWSGALSRELAQALNDWLPAVLQTVKPYFTPDDIEKGSRWSNEIANELEVSQLGIFCLTRENLQSQWIMFEAGAISKRLGAAKVCPLLFGVEPSDLTGPLNQFQATPYSKIEVRKLIKTINGLCGDNALGDSTRDSVFEMWWPKLDEKIKAILTDYAGKGPSAVRDDRDILEEILELSRLTARGDFSRKMDRVSPLAVRDLAESFKELMIAVRERKPHDHLIRSLQELRMPIEHICRRHRVGEDGHLSSMASLMGEIDSISFEMPGHDSEGESAKE